MDRCSYIDIYNNKVADCKHQVTAMLEAFSVYYSIPFNHRGWEFTGCWSHFSLPAGDGGGCGDGTVSGLTSLHAEVFLRPVTGPALLIRGPVVDVTLRFDQRCAAVFLFFFLNINVHLSSVLLPSRNRTETPRTDIFRPLNSPWLTSFSNRRLGFLFFFSLLNGPSQRSPLS